MSYIDMHVHMVSRTTDDYRRMALAGCRAVTEPAFWAGFDRSSPESFEDYFRQLTEVEPRRAAGFGIQHFTWLCLNPKEGDDRALAAEVLKRIPAFLTRPTVVGIGEIGLNRVTRNELTTFEEHVDLAVAHGQLMLIHTPHLEDKHKGTRIIVDYLKSRADVDRSRVLIDHAEEHTLKLILDAGFWAGITLYPQTKASPERAVDMVEVYGAERICVNSACDWGESDPLAVPAFRLALRRRGYGDALGSQITLDNPAAFLSGSRHFRESGWVAYAP